MRSAVIYGSFLDATEDLEPELFKSVWLTILRYAIDREEPKDMQPVEKIIFELVRPNIDKNLNRRKTIDNNCEQLSTIANNCEQESTTSNDEDEDVDVDVDKDIEGDVEGDAEKKASSTPKKPSKRRHGEYQKVLLTDEELRKLTDEFGDEKTEKAITYLDEYIAEKNYKSRSHYLAIRRWVFDALDRQTKKAAGEYESRLPDWSKY